ncbi:MAG: ROK family protein [Roseateles sp.]|uniref:ROK family protein n=1 Tax=Roseateles sp. TaxID=1971397 RepID=UPI0040361BD8
MYATFPGSQNLLRAMNRMALVRHLCAHPGLSRSDLADAVGLTKSTVSLLVRGLIEEGWLLERGVVNTGDLGRRPIPLFIDPARLLLVGVEVGIADVRVVATSLTGEVHAYVVSEYAEEPDAEACIACLGAALLKVRGQFDAARRILGIGIGVPGSVDADRGVVQQAPNLGWRALPFAALLRERLRDSALAGVPLFVLNEAGAAALGEHEFNPSPGANPLLYVSINQGLGAGVVVDGRLMSGSRHYAGEVGHMVLQRDGALCSCGRLGCAEALIAAPLMPYLPGRPGAPAPDAQALDSAGRHLGMLLQNLATAYDPGCIVLGGAAMSMGEPFLQPALRVLTDYAAAARLAPPTVRTSRFGAHAVGVGAAALARHRLTRPTAPLQASGALNTHFPEPA